MLRTWLRKHVTNYNKLQGARVPAKQKKIIIIIAISIKLRACQVYIYPQLTIFYVDSGYEIYRAVGKSLATF